MLSALNDAVTVCLKVPLFTPRLHRDVQSLELIAADLVNAHVSDSCAMTHLWAALQRCSTASMLYALLCDQSIFSRDGLQLCQAEQSRLCQTGSHIQEQNSASEQFSKKKKKKTYIVSGSCRNTKIEETDEIREIISTSTVSAGSMLRFCSALGWICSRICLWFLYILQFSHCMLYIADALLELQLFPFV